MPSAKRVVSTHRSPQGAKVTAINFTITKTGIPIATVVDGRHYVVDWKASIILGYPGDATSGGIFHGANCELHVHESLRSVARELSRWPSGTDRSPHERHQQRPWRPR